MDNVCMAIYLEFTYLRSRGVDEEGSQSLTRVILRPISQTRVNVTLNWLTHADIIALLILRRRQTKHLHEDC